MRANILNPFLANQQLLLGKNEILHSYDVSILWFGIIAILQLGNWAIWRFGNLMIWQFNNLATLFFGSFRILQFYIFQYYNLAILQLDNNQKLDYFINFWRYLAKNCICRVALAFGLAKFPNSQTAEKLVNHWMKTPIHI